MKKLLVILIFTTTLLSNDVEELYFDSKNVIAFYEGKEDFTDEQFMKVTTTVGYFHGLIDYNKWYSIYNRYNKKANKELYDNKLNSKICLNSVSPFQLAKTLVFFLDNNPKFFKEKKLVAIWGMLSQFKCDPTINK